MTIDLNYVASIPCSEIPEWPNVDVRYLNNGAAITANSLVAGKLYSVCMEIIPGCEELCRESLRQAIAIDVEMDKGESKHL